MKEVRGILECNKNYYEFKDNYVIGRTYRHKNEFYFDLEDFDLLSQYHWKKCDGRVVTKINGKEMSMHKMLLGEGSYIHKNGNKSDNRKENLIPTYHAHNDGKVFLNGYISIYMPEHERAFDNGCVYEHILVAEKMLGRKLLPEECVHHIDKDRTNNDESNLMVFATDNDHIAFHAGAETILLENGSYICPNIKGTYVYTYTYNNRTKQDIDLQKEDKGSISIYVNKNICPICRINLKERKAKMCIYCRKQERKKIPISKEGLEKLIYEKTFAQIGREYGVSGDTISRWCKNYGLPYRKKDIKTKSIL